MKRILSLVTALLVLSATIIGSTFLLSGCSKEKDATTVSQQKTPANDADTSLTPVTLNEVAHSIFYAPMYVAIENGYFAEEGIDLTLINGSGADNVMTALISGDADIGFMGSEASIYVYTEGMADYVVNFAQLTQRAGNFLVARNTLSDNTKANPNTFAWEQLKGAKVLGGRAGVRH